MAMANVPTASRLLGASLLLLSLGRPAAGSEQHRLRSSLRGTRGVALDTPPVVCDGNDQVFRLDLRPREEGCDVPWVLERQYKTRYIRVAGTETARAYTGMCLRDGEYRLTIDDVDVCGDAFDASEGRYAVMLDGEEVPTGENFGEMVEFAVSAGSFPGKVPFAGKRPASRPQAISALAGATASKVEALPVQPSDDGALVLAVYTDPDHEETVYDAVHDSKPEEPAGPIAQVDDQDAADPADDRDDTEDGLVESTAGLDETQASAPSADTEGPSAEPIVPMEEQDAMDAGDVATQASAPSADAEEPSVKESPPTGASADQGKESLDTQPSQTWATALDGRLRQFRRRGRRARRRRGDVRP